MGKPATDGMPAVRVVSSHRRGSSSKGKHSGSVVSSLGGPLSSTKHKRYQQYNQLKQIVQQLKQYRDTDELMLKNLRSELDIYRKRATDSKRLQEDNDKLKLDLLDAQQQLLQLKKENADLRRQNQLQNRAVPEETQKEMRRIKMKVNKAISKCEEYKAKNIVLERRLRQSNVSPKDLNLSGNMMQGSQNGHGSFRHQGHDSSRRHSQHDSPKGRSMGSPKGSSKGSPKGMQIDDGPGRNGRRRSRRRSSHRSSHRSHKSQRSSHKSRPSRTEELHNGKPHQVVSSSVTESFLSREAEDMEWVPPVTTRASEWVPPPEQEDIAGIPLHVVVADVAKAEDDEHESFSHPPPVPSITVPMGATGKSVASSLQPTGAVTADGRKEPRRSVAPRIKSQVEQWEEEMLAKLKAEEMQRQMEEELKKQGAEQRKKLQEAREEADYDAESESEETSESSAEPPPKPTVNTKIPGFFIQESPAEAWKRRKEQQRLKKEGKLKPKKEPKSRIKIEKKNVWVANKHLTGAVKEDDANVPEFLRKFKAIGHGGAENFVEASGTVAVRSGVMVTAKGIVYQGQAALEKAAEEKRIREEEERLKLEKEEEEWYEMMAKQKEEEERQDMEEKRIRDLQAEEAREARAKKIREENEAKERAAKERAEKEAKEKAEKEAQEKAEQEKKAQEAAAAPAAAAPTPPPPAAAPTPPPPAAAAPAPPAAVAAAPPAAAAPAPKKKSFFSDSSSEDESTVPPKKAAAAAAPAKKKKSSFFSDSDSDSSS